MVMSKMKMKTKVEEFEEGEILSQEDGEFIPPHLLLEKHGHDPIKNSYILDSMAMSKMKRKVQDFEDGEFIPPQLLLEKHCYHPRHADADASKGRKRQRFGRSETHVGESSKANLNILNSMVMSKLKMKINFEQGEIITQQHFLEDGEFIPPQPLLQTRRGKEKHCCDPRNADGRQRFGQVVAHTHVGESSKANSLGAAADIKGKEKQLHHHLKRERFADADVGESSTANTLGGAAADVRLTGDCAKRQKRCCSGDSDEVAHLSKLLRATELKLKCAGVILKSQSAPDFPAAKLRHSCL